MLFRNYTKKKTRIGHEKNMYFRLLMGYRQCTENFPTRFVTATRVDQIILNAPRM